MTVIIWYINATGCLSATPDLSGRQTPATNLSLVVTQIAVLAGFCLFTTTFLADSCSGHLARGIVCRPAWLSLICSLFLRKVVILHGLFLLRTTYAGERCGRHARHFSSSSPVLLTPG